MHVTANGRGPDTNTSPVCVEINAVIPGSVPVSNVTKEVRYESTLTDVGMNVTDWQKNAINIVVTSSKTNRIVYPNIK